jgi:hypothetical protein
LKDDEKKENVINMLVIMLNVEYRRNISDVLRLIRKVVEKKKYKKMYINNVEMIIEKYIVCNKYVNNDGKGNLREVEEICCGLKEKMLEIGEEMWVVNEYIVKEIRSVNEEEK